MSTTTMRLTEQQLAILKGHEDRNYVDFIRGNILLDYPGLADDPTLRDRLNAAYTRTRELGFTHDGPIVDFLYMEATAPGFHTVPAIAAWLNKPGVTAERRFELLLQVTHKVQQKMKEKN